MELVEIEEFIKETNLLGQGSEVSVYNYGDQVIKIFHKDRKTAIERISNEGLVKLTTLNLTTFNTPTDIIYDNGQIVGYIERKLKDEELDLSKIDYEKLHEDIITLSNNGYRLQDFYYNYMISDDNFYFTDLTCFMYQDVKVDFLKQKFYKENIKEINRFLVGLHEFNAYRKGEEPSITRTYLINEYISNNRIVEYYGDRLKEKRK